MSILGERYSHGHVFDFYESLRANPRELRVLGDGHQRKSYLHVADCVDAMLLAIERAPDAVNIFNLGTDEYCEVNDSIGWITDRLGVSPKLTYTGGTARLGRRQPVHFSGLLQNPASWLDADAVHPRRDYQDARLPAGQLVGPRGARMKVAVLGLWHLGTVTAACLASAGHDVVGIDTDANVVAALREGRPPVFEPGLEELVKDGLRSKKLSFSSDMRALRDAELVWVTFDTPVDEDDRADIRGVVEAVKKSFGDLAHSAVVVISSQLPVGTTAKLQEACATAFQDKHVVFASSPENLRLGRAIAAFMQPDRVVVGVAAAAARERIEQCLRPITTRIEWMSVESAEMTKHALNAFLATSVVFANEVASICETVGADAAEVERGLKSDEPDRRIGVPFTWGRCERRHVAARCRVISVDLGGANGARAPSRRHAVRATTRTRHGHVAGSRTPWARFAAGGSPSGG